MRNGALVARKVLVRRFGAKWMMVRAAVERKRFVIEERVEELEESGESGKEESVGTVGEVDEKDATVEGVLDPSGS